MEMVEKVNLTDDQSPENGQPEVIYRKAKTWQMATFTLSSGANMFFYVLMTYVSYIANAGYGIAVALTGVIITFSRLFDGVTDPFVALLVDRINTRFGKIRILMWIGWGIESLALILMFIVGSTGNNGLVFFVIAYGLYIIGYTIFGVSTNIVGPIMINDPEQRPKLARWQTVYSYLFPMIMTIVVTMVFLPRFGNEYTIPMLRTTTIFAIIASGILVFIACFGVKEVDKKENFISVSAKEKKEHKVSFKDMWALLKNNKAFQMYIVAAASDKLALSTAGQAIIQTMFYGILIGNMQLGTMFSVGMMIPSLLAVFLASKMAGKRGNKETNAIWTFFSLVFGVILIIFLANIDTRSLLVDIVPTVIFIVLMVIFNGFKMGVTASAGSMLADIVDIEMARSNNFMPGTVAATYSFIDKLISSFSSTLAAFGVAFIGYKTVMPQPTDDISTGVFWMTMFLMFGMPIIGWICTLIAHKFSPLTREYMIEVQRNNHELRKQAKEIA